MKFYRLEKLINGYKVDPKFKGKDETITTRTMDDLQNMGL
jgi:hypothetical protein